MLALIVAIVAVILLLPTGETSKEAETQTEATTLVKAGDTAPDFTVEMIDGSSVTLGSLKGKVVLLNFWATWCPPCRKEMTRVGKDIIERFAGRDFVFLPISRGEGCSAVGAFREKNGYDFPMGLDSTKAVFGLYASNYIPRNFLIDREDYAKRKDLIFTGRTLFGAMPPKGQEMDDHYFGALRPRVAAFMQDLDEELWKLGILSKTKHNEVAPAQHEMAPVFSDANSACDQNQLAMEMMKKVADRHGLVCLLHEKPFAGVNGSGKHDNWSLSTDTGKNLFKPGSTPRQNAQFLLFLAAFIKGVDDYQEFLRATVAFPGNDHRLGAQEAPPAVLSIFLGDELSAVVDSIINDTDFQSTGKRTLEIGVDALPAIRQDNTDRNRTSPMAFTGNKFEFRMLGASQSISGPNIALNTIMAEELEQFADELEVSRDFQADLEKLIRRVFTEHQRIIFNGNGYDEAWLEEAKKRGLSNLTSTADALPMYTAPKNVDLFVKHGIYTKEEIEARAEIHIENYTTVLTIEAKTMADMIRHQILPAVSDYADQLCQRAYHKDAMGVPHQYETSTAMQIGTLTDALQADCAKLEADLAAIPVGSIKAMNYCHEVLIPDMAEARKAADQLETLTASKSWPFPVYSDLLFYV